MVTIDVVGTSEGAQMLLAAGHATSSDKAAAVVAGVVSAVFFAGLIVFVLRWRRVRGATSRADALNRAFGEHGASRVIAGSFACAGVLLVVAVVVAVTGG